MSNTPSEELRLLLQEARSALWQPANAALCERIDDALARLGTQQPVAREPLTANQVSGLAESAGYWHGDMSRADFINGIRDAEAAHGITQKGGA